jgi:hypothetical protein
MRTISLSSAGLVAVPDSGFARIGTFGLGRRIPCQGIDVSAASGLDAILEPLSRCLDPESARRIVDFQVDWPVQERIDALAELANEGTLSDSERSEYEALINASDFISILKLKARPLRILPFCTKNIVA